MDAAAVADVPPHLQTFLAFDFGLKRTGVASGNRLLRHAQPRGTLKAEGDARWPLIQKSIAQWQPDALVVGVPFHPMAPATKIRSARAGSPGSCMGRFRLPVFEVDERYSTTEALQAGARDADAAAACIILEQFLRSLEVSTLMLDAEALYRELLRGVRNCARATTRGWWASPPAAPGWPSGCRKTWACPAARA
jgi:putative Holliday junction resolvase